MPAMSSEIIRVVPSYYIISLFIIGFFLLLLSPLHYVLPSWYNPFVQEKPTEALSSITIFALSSLAVGILPFLVREKILGNKGLNECISKPRKLLLNYFMKKGKFSQSQPEKLSEKQQPRAFQK